MPPVRPVATLIATLAAVLAVAGAGVAGWQLAGPPADGAGTVPPPCPAVLTAESLAAGRGGVPDRIVPVPLPQPRGPVAARICRYGPAGGALQRSAALDPPRTARLAGVLNTPPSGVAVGTARPADCRPGGPVTVLVLRYTQGAPLTVEVDGGGCALVSTSARVERGRGDVLDLLGELDPAR